MNEYEIKGCRRCLYTTAHPLGLTIDNDGICSGCRVHEEKDNLDWDNRWSSLETMVAPYRTRDNRNYDCVVPVTGGGDSFFIVHLVKERLKLKPLLVTYNRYYNTPLGIKNLAQLRRRFDCDILIQSVDPRIVKKIIRTTLPLLNSYHWPVLAGQSAFPVQTAVSYGIPLIIWGAHQGLEQVGMYSHLHEVEMTRRYRKDHDLMGYEADDLLNTFNVLREADIWQYRYPQDSAIASVGVRGIYLGNYVRWDPLAQHIKMTKIAGYSSARMQRTFDIYDHVDDWHYMGLHDLLKQAKYGYGKVLDHACREIRHRRLDREYAQYLVSNYTHQSADFINLFFDWLDIDRKSFSALFLSSQSKSNIDDPSKTNIEQPLNHLGKSKDIFNMLRANCEFDMGMEHNHICIGKGYP
jgi:N-acetyl sugar amidotransferase